MNYAIFIFALFTLASVLYSYKLALTLKQQGTKEIQTYDVLTLIIFLALAVGKIPEVFELTLPDITTTPFYVVFLILGVWAAVRLNKKLKTKAKFKVYRSDLFVLIFSVLIAVLLFFDL